MADNIGTSDGFSPTTDNCSRGKVVNSEASACSDVIWQNKLSKLFEIFRKEKKVNQKLFNRLHHVKKIIQKTQRENSFIAAELDRHGDKYRLIDTYFASSVLSNGRAATTVRNAKVTVKKPAQKQVAHKSEKSSVEKDPNAPKKPANAFFMYCQQKRSDILLGNPTLNHHDLTKLLAKSWNQLNSEEKQVYYEMYEQDKERYEKQLKEYTENGQFTPATKLKDLPLSSSLPDNKEEQRDNIKARTLQISPESSLGCLPNTEMMAEPCYDLPSMPSSAARENDEEDARDSSFHLDID